MAYVAKTDWADDPAHADYTPPEGVSKLSAADLNRMEQGIADADSAANAAAPSEHSHAAGEVTSGTFAVARIPNLAQSKITGLSDALASKAGTEDIPAPQFTAAEVAALKALVADEG